MVSIIYCIFIHYNIHSFLIYHLSLENYLRIGVFRCLSSVFNSELPDFEKELILEKKTDIINLCLYLFKVSINTFKKKLVLTMYYNFIF